MSSVDCVLRVDCIALHGAEMVIDGCRLAGGRGSAFSTAAVDA